MDGSITVPNSVFVNGQWATAHWMADVVDEETGELIITATLAGGAGQGPVVTALRMDMALARQLRQMALDGAAADEQPCYDCRTTGERLDASERRVRELALVTTNHEQRIELLVSTLTNTNGRVAALEEWQVETDDKLGILEGRIDNDANALLQRLVALEEWQVKTDEQVREMERRKVSQLDQAFARHFKKTSQQMNEMAGRMDALETQMRPELLQQSDIDAIRGQVAILHSRVDLFARARANQVFHGPFNS